MSDAPKKRKLTLQQAARRVFRSLPVVGQPGRLGPRPVRRGDCEDGPRPCPWAECRYHLAVDHTNERWGGAVVVASSSFDWATKATCALDAAEVGESTVEEVGEMMGLPRRTVQRSLRRALAKIEALGLGALLSASPED